MTTSFYVLPVVRNPAGRRGPKYFRYYPGQDPTGLILSPWGMMDYGFIDVALLVAIDIAPSSDTFLRAQANVYPLPADIDISISDRARIDTFFETINIPTDWLTPSSTYREFFRNMAGMFQFNQRYGTISSGQSLLGGGVTLETRWGALSVQQQAWFNETIVSFGYTYTVSGNPKLRVLAKQAGDLWGAQPFLLAGVTF